MKNLKTPELIQPETFLTDIPTLICDALTNVLVAEDVLAEREPLDPAAQAAWCVETLPDLRHLSLRVRTLYDAIWLAQFAATRNAAFLQQGDLIAEMRRQWHDDPALAQTFWTYVFYENHPDGRHVTRLLADTYRDWLRKARLNIKTTQPRPWRAKAARAWDTFQLED